MQSHASLRHLLLWPHAAEGCAALHIRSARMARAAMLVVVVLSAARPALAQFEFTGSWTPVASEDFSNDSLPVDYMGLPLTEEGRSRSEEHTSELQSLRHLVCRLLLEKKK